MAGEKIEILPDTIQLTLGINDVLLLRNADEVPQASVQPQHEHDFAAGHVGQQDLYDLAGVAAEDAHAGSDLDAVDLPEAGLDLKSVAPQPLPAADGEQPDRPQDQTQENRGAE